MAGNMFNKMANMFKLKIDPRIHWTIEKIESQLRLFRLLKHLNARFHVTSGYVLLCTPVLGRNV